MFWCLNWFNVGLALIHLCSFWAPWEIEIIYIDLKPRKTCSYRVAATNPEVRVSKTVYAQLAYNVLPLSLGGCRHGSGFLTFLWSYRKKVLLCERHNLNCFYVDLFCPKPRLNSTLFFLNVIILTCCQMQHSSPHRHKHAHFTAFLWKCLQFWGQVFRWVKCVVLALVLLRGEKNPPN